MSTTNSSPQTPENNHLGTQTIPRLLLKYAVPSVVSMLVMSLYNIVDQIFIGWGVGYLGNTATTVAFPLTTVGLAMALLIGNGSAAFISLELGKGRSDQAKKTVGNAMTLLIVCGVVYAALVLVFLRPVLSVLGATDTIMPYAVDYTSIIMLGMPFAMLGTSLSNIIRADGSPRYSMVSTVFGAVLNTILDPIFIFVFGMGVKGAAIATVLSQMISAGLTLYYVLRRAKFTRLSGRNMRLDGGLMRRVLALGSSSFITQAAITVVNVVLNNSLRHYGGLSSYGAEIPLAAMGIVMKINSILISTILGICIGAQPILGYNYGAGNYERVKRTYKTGLSITASVSTICCLLFIFTPEPFIAMFGDSSPEFTEFACRAMSIFLSCVFCAGIQIPSSNYFQAVGKPLKAMTLSMSRQILFLVPLILILPLFFGLDGILYAGPVGDLCALAVTGVFILREMRHLNLVIRDDAAGAYPVTEG